VARIDNTQLRHFPAKLLTLGVLPDVNSFCLTASEKKQHSVLKSSLVTFFQESDRLLSLSLPLDLL